MDYDTSKQPTKEEALEIMTSRLHNGGLYLLHAVSSANTAALGDFIDYARAQGYTFVEYLKK
jgi:peptidoglycan-N-acetylmuramic acid deacetylase